MEFEYFFSQERFEAPPIIKPNRITGVGRKKSRPWARDKTPNLKKKEHRKMVKKSRRRNRRK